MQLNEKTNQKIWTQEAAAYDKMNPKLKSILYFSCFLFPAAGLSQQDQLWNEVRKIIRFESGIDFQIVQGMVIGIWDHDSTYFLTYGEGLKEDHLFELGSLTKPIVAYVTEQVLLEKDQDLNKSICMHLPDSICSDAWNHVSVGQMLHHQAGLPRMPDDIGLIEEDVQDPYENYTEHHLAKDLKELSPTAGRYSYSQLNYAALHWLLEDGGGTDHVLEKFLAEKMGLNSMTMLTEKGELAPGFGFDGKLQPPWNTNAFSLSLGMRSNAADLISYIQHRAPSLSGTCGQMTKALKKELYEMEKAKTYKLCEGWFLIESGKKDLIFYQNGRTGGHHAAAAFEPGKQIGVVVLTSGVSGSNDLCFSILTMLKRAKKSRS